MAQVKILELLETYYNENLTRAQGHARTSICFRTLQHYHHKQGVSFNSIKDKARYEGGRQNFV